MFWDDNRVKNRQAPNPIGDRLYFFEILAKKPYICISTYLHIICIVCVYIYIFIIFFTPNIYNIYIIYVYMGCEKRIYTHAYIYIYIYIYINIKIIWFFCFLKTKILKKQKRPPIGFGAWRFFTLLSSQNMITQKSRVSYLAKFKMVQTHRDCDGRYRFWVFINVKKYA